MAVKQIQKNRKNAEGTFDVIHYETEAGLVLMEDGTTAEEAIGAKQNKLTFDDVPTASSVNPVTSGGVYNALPTKTSQLTNDSGYITGYTETDPTVPAWAKAAAKPSYTAEEVGALPDTTVIPSKLSDLSGDATHRVVTDAEKTAWDAKADKPKAVAVTLTAAGWVDGVQTVTVPGVSADETAQEIRPMPAMASQTAYIEAGIRCTAQADNSLTFTADTAPAEDLTVYATITDVDYQG